MLIISYSMQKKFAKLHFTDTSAKMAAPNIVSQKYDWYSKWACKLCITVNFTSNDTICSMCSTDRDDPKIAKFLQQISDSEYVPEMEEDGSIVPMKWYDEVPELITDDTKYGQTLMSMKWDQFDCSNDMELSQCGKWLRICDTTLINFVHHHNKKTLILVLENQWEERWLHWMKFDYYFTNVTQQEIILNNILSMI